MKKFLEPPHVKRGLGRLKNGNPPGDFRNAPRCGAVTRKQTPCKSPAMKNGRCRMHGGLSTGAKTETGLCIVREINLKHGQYSSEAIKRKRELSALLRVIRRTYSKPQRV